MTQRPGFLAILLLALAALAVPGPARAQVILSGEYRGLGDAAGAVIEIAPDAEGFVGVFRDARGREQRFEADRTGDAAEAVLDMDNRTVLMQMRPLPYGAEVALIPFDGKGALVLEAARLLTFLAPGQALPTVPEGYVDPPAEGTRALAANSFLASYEFWRPGGVRDGYLALAPRFRTLMRLFPAVQLDVIWKLCLAPRSDGALAMALRGQDVTCEAVLSGLAAAQAQGRFAAYKAEVAAQRDVLRTAVRCADGYVVSSRECDAASRKLAQAAVGLDTAGAVLRRYR